MKKTTTLITLVMVLTWGPLVIAGTSHQGHDDTSKSHSDTMEHGAKGDMSESHSGTMEHGEKGDMFSHRDVVEGVRAEFQVMSLASMNMNDPAGNTHHIMVKFFDDGMNHQIKDVAGKIKVISPSGKEQEASLKDYSGIYAANFTFAEKGKYGVICLFKVDGQKRLVKFWYPHG